MTGLEVALLLVGLVALVVGGDLLVKGSSSLASILGIPSIVVGLTVVAFGTSAPEMAVSVEAGFSGHPNIALANVVGSNIFNTFFILGVSALVAPLLIQKQIIRRELPFLVVITMLVAALAIDGMLVPWESVALFLILVGYLYWLVRVTLRDRSLARQELAADGGSSPEASAKDGLKSLLLVVGGLAIVIKGADWTVHGAVQLASMLGVSDTVIGLTIVAAGTSLPEVVASVTASLKGERDIAVGNVIGSNIFNLLAILGVAGAVTPGGLSVAGSLISYDIPVMILSAVVLVPLFLQKGQTVGRSGGSLLASGYVLYTGYLVWTS